MLPESPPTTKSSSEETQDEKSVHSYTDSSSSECEMEFDAEDSDTAPFILPREPTQPQLTTNDGFCGRFRSLSRRKQIIATVCLVPLLFFTLSKMCCITSSEMPESHHSEEDDRRVLRMRRCTYQDLDDAFRGVIHPPSPQKSMLNFSIDGSEKCWSLADEVLRVPAKAIDHHRLVRLGSGYKGGVYAAVIHLSGDAHGDVLGDTCVVAMKSDHCHTKNFVKSNWFEKRTHHSCIERGTFLLNPTSFMGSEYNAALFYHALQHMKAQNSSSTSLAHRAEHGLLPTWGVVQDVGHPMRTLVRRKRLDGTPHHDGTIKAVIMPLIDFVPLLSLPSARRRDLVRDVRTIARAWLPAAVGLSVVSGMRYSLNDIQPKNVGVRTVENTTVASDRPREYEIFLYDHSYIMYQDGQTCALPDDQSVGCDFCMDRNFYHHHPTAEMNEMEMDAANVRRMIIRLLHECPEESAAKSDLLDSMELARTAQDLVDALEAFQ